MESYCSERMSNTRERGIVFITINISTLPYLLTGTEGLPIPSCKETDSSVSGLLHVSDLLLRKMGKRRHS